VNQSATNVTCVNCPEWRLPLRKIESPQPKA
jgi:hypothetical protein